MKEEIEKTETGYRLKIETTRGTGTRDQDTVKAEAEAKSLKQLDEERVGLRVMVREEMEDRRKHQPDGDEDG